MVATSSNWLSPYFFAQFFSTTDCNRYTRILVSSLSSFFSISLLSLPTFTMNESTSYFMNLLGEKVGAKEKWERRNERGREAMQVEPGNEEKGSKSGKVLESLSLVSWEREEMQHGSILSTIFFTSPSSVPPPSLTISPFRDRKRVSDWIRKKKEKSMPNLTFLEWMKIGRKVKSQRERERERVWK